MSQSRRHPRGEDPYLEWHRSASLERFLPRNVAQALSMIDIDGCEYCHLCGEPVALTETTCSARPKNARVMAKLAEWARVPAYVVAYDGAGFDGGFTVRDVAGGTPVRMTQERFARWLWELRVPHWRGECAHPCANPARGAMLLRAVTPERNTQ